MLIYYYLCIDLVIFNVFNLVVFIFESIKY